MKLICPSPLASSRPYLNFLFLRRKVSIRFDLFIDEISAIDTWSAHAEGFFDIGFCSTDGKRQPQYIEKFESRKHPALFAGSGG